MIVGRQLMQCNDLFDYLLKTCRLKVAEEKEIFGEQEKGCKRMYI